MCVNIMTDPQEVDTWLGPAGGSRGIPYAICLNDFFSCRLGAECLDNIAGRPHFVFTIDSTDRFY